MLVLQRSLLPADHHFGREKSSSRSHPHSRRALTPFLSPLECLSLLPSCNILLFLLPLPPSQNTGSFPFFPLAFYAPLCASPSSPSLMFSSPALPLIPLVRHRHLAGNRALIDKRGPREPCIDYGRSEREKERQRARGREGRGRECGEAGREERAGGGGNHVRYPHNMVQCILNTPSPLPSALMVRPTAPSCRRCHLHPTSASSAWQPRLVCWCFVLCVGGGARFV